MDRTVQCLAKKYGRTFMQKLITRHIPLNSLQKIAVVAIAAIIGTWYTMEKKISSLDPRLTEKPLARASSVRLANVPVEISQKFQDVSYAYNPLFEKAMQDFKIWAIQILCFSISIIYGGTGPNLCQELNPRYLKTKEARPFSQTILQASRIYARINQFCYPHVAVGLLSIYWKFNENITMYCLLVNSLWIIVIVLRVYALVQDFETSVKPDNVLRSGLAIIQILAGIHYGNIFVSLGGLAMLKCIYLTPPFSIFNFLQPRKFKDYLFWMCSAGALNTLAFYLMIGSLQCKDIYKYACQNGVSIVPYSLATEYWHCKTWPRVK